jgi:hypothetical protein
VLRRRIGRFRGEEALDRRLQLGGRVDPSARREEEAGSVGLALEAAEEPVAPVAEPEPAPVLGEPLPARAGDELGGVGVGRGPGRGDGERQGEWDHAVGKR